MNKKIIITIVIIILAAVLFWVIKSGIFSKPAIEQVKIPEGILLFYGDGCPHCKIVDEFLAQNKIEEKIEFSKLEVWYNKDNQKIIIQIAQKCNIASNKIGVPLLYDGNKCYSGDVDIISFFKEKTGIK